MSLTVISKYILALNIVLFNPLDVYLYLNDLMVKLSVERQNDTKTHIQLL